MKMYGFFVYLKILFPIPFNFLQSAVKGDLVRHVCIRATPSVGSNCATNRGQTIRRDRPILPPQLYPHHTGQHLYRWAKPSIDSARCANARKCQRFSLY
jgi:hypothetical protein